MKNYKLFMIILSVLFANISCNNILEPSGISNSIDNKTNTSGSGNNVDIVSPLKKTMYFEFKFDGESPDNWTYIDKEYGKGVRDVLFQIDGIPSAYLFRGMGGMEGYSYRYLFTKDNGKYFEIPFYIGDEYLKKDYRSTDKTVSLMPKIAFGMAFSTSDTIQGINRVYSIYKSPFVAELKNYDETIHTNVARFHVHLYQVEKELYPDGPMLWVSDYTITFDGFKSK